MVKVRFKFENDSSCTDEVAEGRQQRNAMRAREKHRWRTDMELSCAIVVQTFSFIVWLGLSTAMIVMGALYKDQCPIQPYIPIFLLVTGASHLAVIAVLFLKFVSEICSMVLEGIIGIFSFAWFIVGSIWVFKVYPEYEGNCNKELYLFAFGILCVEYVLIGLSIFCPCFCCAKRIFYER
ncbi:transmembrane protein 272-like [Gastrophryne carolinensis]